MDYNNVENFGIHVESCRQSAGVLLSRYPKNEMILQIMGGCQSLCGNHKQAIDYYRRCIELNEGSIAYSNNQAWNYLQLKDNQVALALLNDIKSKWNHPAIYLNLVAALQNSRHQQTQINAAFRMIETSAKNYPHYDQNDKPLIYTFLLQPNQYYNSQIDKFKTQIFQFVTILQNFIDAPFNYQFINSRLKQLSQQIHFRKQQEQKYGIIIENQLKAVFEALQVFRTTILYNYNEQYSQELNKYVSKSIEILNQNILIQPLDQNSDYEKFQNQKIIPCAIQLQQIAIRMKEIVNLFQSKKHKPHEQSNPNNFNYIKKEQQKQPNIKVYNEPKIINPDKKVQEIKHLYNPNQFEWSEQQKLKQSKRLIKQVQNDEKQYKKYEKQLPNNIKLNQQQKQRQLKQDLQREKDLKKDQEINRQQTESKNIYQRPEFSDYNYQFHVRMDDITSILQENEKSMIQTLRVEGENVASPLFFIVHFRKQKVDIFNVFLNKNRIRRELLNEPGLPNLPRLQNQQQKNKILKYYYILTLLLRFYNYYATHNFEYRRKDIVSNIQIDHFIELITPVLNEIFNGEQLWGNSRVGWICNQIHFAKCKYVSQTGQRGSYLQVRNQLLKKIHSIVREEENPAQQLVRDILAQDSLQYSDALLSQQLKEIDGSTKYHNYYNWKMSRYHKLHRNSEIRQAFTTDDEWIIFNLSILLIALSQNQNHSHHHLLYQTFVDLYYSSRVSQSTRDSILIKFYRANHTIASIEEAKIAFIKLCRKILL